MDHWNKLAEKHNYQTAVRKCHVQYPSLKECIFEQPRVFVISPHKTGTSSLRAALNSLGYNCSAFFTHNKNRDLDWWKKELAYPKYSIQLVQGRGPRDSIGYNAFQDTPWWVIYQHIDRAFPFSKFIFIDRDEDLWFRSAHNWFCRGHGTIHPSYEIIYGSAKPVKSLWVKNYVLHRESVFNHFKNRPNDLLIMHINDLNKNGYKNICKFLGKSNPKAKSFPQINRSR